MRARPSSTARRLRVNIRGRCFYQKLPGRGKHSCAKPVAIVGALGHTPRAMTPLRRAGRRGVYALALVTVAATALPALTRAQVPLSQENPSRLRNSYNRPQASQKLDEAVRKVNSDDPDQRLEGVKDLGELEGETRAVEYLMQAVNDPDQRVRIKAIDTLGNVKAKDATPFLVQQLFLRDTDVTTRQHILAALGKIGDKRATASLLDIVARANDPARGNAIFALGDIGDPAALAPLRALARSGADEPLRRLAEGDSEDRAAARADGRAAGARCRSARRGAGRHALRARGALARSRAQVLLQRLGDEGPQEPAFPETLEPDAAPEVLRDAGVQVDQRFAACFGLGLAGRHHSLPPHPS